MTGRATRRRVSRCGRPPLTSTVDEPAPLIPSARRLDPADLVVLRARLGHEGELDLLAGFEARQVDVGRDGEVHRHGRPVDRRHRAVAQIDRVLAGIDLVDLAAPLPRLPQPAPSWVLTHPPPHPSLPAGN